MAIARGRVGGISASIKISDSYIFPAARLPLLPRQSQSAADGQGALQQRGRTYYSHCGANLHSVRHDGQQISDDKAVTGADGSREARRR